MIHQLFTTGGDRDSGEISGLRDRVNNGGDSRSGWMAALLEKLNTDQSNIGGSVEDGTGHTDTGLDKSFGNGFPGEHLKYFGQNENGKNPKLLSTRPTRFNIPVSQVQAESEEDLASLKEENLLKPDTGSKLKAGAPDLVEADGELVETDGELNDNVDKSGSDANEQNDLQKLDSGSPKMEEGSGESLPVDQSSGESAKPLSDIGRQEEGSSPRESKVVNKSDTESDLLGRADLKSAAGRVGETATKSNVHLGSEEEPQSASKEPTVVSKDTSNSSKELDIGSKISAAESKDPVKKKGVQEPKVGQNFQHAGNLQSDLVGSLHSANTDSSAIPGYTDPIPRESKDLAIDVDQNRNLIDGKRESNGQKYPQLSARLSHLASRLNPVAEGFGENKTVEGRNVSDPALINQGGSQRFNSGQQELDGQLFEIPIDEQGKMSRARRERNRDAVGRNRSTRSNGLAGFNSRTATMQSSPSRFSGIFENHSPFYLSSSSQEGSAGQLQIEEELESDQLVFEKIESDELKREEVRNSFMRLNQMALSNASLRREVANGIARTVISSVPQGQSSSETWQKHQLVLEDGKKVQISARRIDGVLQLRLSSVHQELNKLIQTYQNEIREHLQKECETDVELQFEGKDQDGEPELFGDSDGRNKQSQGSLGEAAGDGEEKGGEDRSPRNSRKFGAHQNEWTA